MTGYSDLIEAFQNLGKYAVERADLGADHDVIYSSVGPDEPSEEDAKRLEELDWFKSEEFDCWAYFV